MVSGFEWIGARGRIAAAGAATLLALGIGHPALAQGIGGMPGAGLGTAGAPPSFGGEQLNNSLKGNLRPPPSALPGATQQQAIAPPTNIPKLMSPNDELFDAINRNDIAAVRDALSRGAQLGAQDELGMTPLELSVDLGRNPITFLLLSMRDADQGPSGPPPAQSAIAAAPKPAAKASGARRHKLHEVAMKSDPPTAASGGQRTLPTLFAADGGTPIPQAGFLGFSGH